MATKYGKTVETDLDKEFARLTGRLSEGKNIKERADLLNNFLKSNPSYSSKVPANLSKYVSRTNGGGSGGASTPTISAGQQAYNDSIAKKGSKTKGTDIGDVREINASQIAPVREVTAPNIGEIERASAAELAPSREINANTVFRDNQVALARDIQDQLSGRRESLAQLQLKEALDRNLANQMGAIAAQRGVGAGLATRTVGRQAGLLNQQTAMNAAQLRAQEVQSLQAQLQQISGEGRAGDTAIDSANQAAVNANNQARAGLVQQANLTNAAASNQRQMEQADTSLRGSLANQQAVNTQNFNQAQLNQSAATGNQSAFNTANINQANVAGGVKQASLGAGATLGAAGLALEGTKYAADTSVVNNAIDNATTIGGNIQESGQASDERLKKNIEPAGGKIDDMLGKLAASIYEYKNKNAHGEGERVGVMAQDLEKSEAGKNMVEEKPDGKYINFTKGLSTILAAQAQLHKRMSALEGRG